MSRKELAEVLYPYRAINPDELSLVVGQTVVIMERNTIYPGWFLGELEGQQGFFPSYFIKIISSSLYTENSLQNSERHTPVEAKFVNNANANLDLPMHINTVTERKPSITGYFALAKVIAVTKTDATAETASSRQFKFLASQFEPSHRLKRRSEDLRIYLHLGDLLKLWLDEEKISFALLNTDRSECFDQMCLGVVDSFVLPLGNIWSSTVGNSPFEIDHSLKLKVGDRVKFQRHIGKDHVWADNITLLESTIKNQLILPQFHSDAAAIRPISLPKEQLRLVKPKVDGKMPMSVKSTTASFYQITGANCTRNQSSRKSTEEEYGNDQTGCWERQSPTDSISLSGSSTTSSTYYYKTRPPLRLSAKSAQPNIDMVIEASRTNNLPITRHSGIGLITTVYQQVARVYCKTGELVSVSSRDFTNEPSGHLYEVLKPLMVAKYEFERRYIVELQKWQEWLLFFQLTNDPYPHWDQLDVCEAVVTGQLKSRSYFSGVFLRNESDRKQKLMMPRYANPVSVEDLALTMPIGKQITVVIAESTNEIKSLEHDSHKVVMLAPKGVKCRLDLISEAADIYSSRDRRGGFSSSDPPPLIDIRDVIEFPKTTLSLVNSERKEVPPRRNPIIWPEGGKVTLEEGLALVTTVYKKVCQIWIPNHGLEIAHVDGLINVRQEFMPLVVKPLQLVKFTSEVCDMKNSSGISRSVVALEPFNDGEFHHWNKLFVGPAWVSSAMETKKANGTKPGFSAVLLKSAMFPDQVIFMPHWAYPQFTMDLPVVLPVGTQLNVIVTHQEFKKRKNIIPLIAIACAPSGIRNITDLESYVNQC